MAFQTSPINYVYMSPQAYMPTVCDREQCSSYFLSEARLCASDPVPCFIQVCVKGESLCKPAKNGHHW